MYESIPKYICMCDLLPGDKQSSGLKGSWGSDCGFVSVYVKTREAEEGQASVSRGLFSPQGMAKVRQPLSF